MASAASQALRDQPGYVARPASAPVATPTYPTLAALPSVPAIDDARAPNAAGRSWLLSQLGPLADQNNAALTNIRSGAKLGLAGYGGWKFGTDDPNTARREDLDLSFDPSTGPGQREKQAIRAENAAANQHGLLYSSINNQNQASALQRLSLEAQQIANQYATSLTTQFSGYAAQVSSVIGQWTGLYGQDAAWLADHPPPTPAPPAEPAAPAPGQVVKAYGGNPKGEALPAGYGVVWTGANPPNRNTMNAKYGPSGWFVVPLANGKYAVAARTG